VVQTNVEQVSKSLQELDSILSCYKLDRASMAYLSTTNAGTTTTTPTSS